MKKIIGKLKDLFGMDEDDAEPQEPAPLKPEPQEDPKPKNKKVSSLPMAPAKREEIIRFIVHALQPFKDEKKLAIAGLSLYVLCKGNETETLINTALVLPIKDAFRDDYLKLELENNYFKLSDNWFFECAFVYDMLPKCDSTEGNYGLKIQIKGKNNGRNNSAKASLTTLVGQTSEKTYELDGSLKQKYFIGRGEQPMLASGRMHTNDIYFLEKKDQGYDNQAATGNEFVSRNHAYIKYSTETNQFLLYADKGGLPENGNKTKIHKLNGNIIKITVAGVGHELANGDILELGGEAKMLIKISVAQ